MITAEINKKFVDLRKVGERNKWLVCKVDYKQGLISFKDELSIYRIDIWVSKMSVGFLAVGEPMKYFKRQNYEAIELMMKEPEKQLFD